VVGVIVPAILVGALLAASLAPQENSPEQPQEAIEVTFERFRDASDAGRFEEAERLGLELLERQRQSWTVNNLVILWTRFGHYDRAQALLEEELARLAQLGRDWRAELARVLEAGDEAAASTARAWRDWIAGERLVLHERSGLFAQARGDHGAARRHLGAALAAGGRDAAQILAHAAFVAGRPAEARSLFRGLLVPRSGESAEDLRQLAPWALRGWGLCLLPAARRTPGAADAAHGPQASATPDR
jgi:tetratricopeptide (TPR) repeat protein